MQISEFVVQHPQYALDFTQPISAQPRIYQGELLAALPPELLPSYAYRSGGRGRPNLNQCLTHAQCATCQRVLRNDHFYAPPSMRRRNVLFPHCRACAQSTQSAARPKLNENDSNVRRWNILRYLGGACTRCGFDRHPSALEPHCPGGSSADKKLESQLHTFIHDPSAYNAEKLLQAAAGACLLCANCHHLLHAGIVGEPTPLRRAPSLDGLLHAVDDG